MVTPWWGRFMNKESYELRNLGSQEIVFCYQNCSDLLWEKNDMVIKKKLLKFEAEGREFAKFLDH